MHSPETHCGCYYIDIHGPCIVHASTNSLWLLLSIIMHGLQEIKATPATHCGCYYHARPTGNQGYSSNSLWLLLSCTAYRKSRLLQQLTVAAIIMHGLQEIKATPATHCGCYYHARPTGNQGYSSNSLWLLLSCTAYRKSRLLQQLTVAAIIMHGLQEIKATPATHCGCYYHARPTGNQGYSSNSLWLLLSIIMHGLQEIKATPATHCGCYYHARPTGNQGYSSNSLWLLLSCTAYRKSRLLQQLTVAAIIMHGLQEIKATPATHCGCYYHARPTGNQGYSSNSLWLLLSCTAYRKSRLLQQLTVAAIIMHGLQEIKATPATHCGCYYHARPTGNQGYSSNSLWLLLSCTAYRKSRLLQQLTVAAIIMHGLQEIKATPATHCGCYYHARPTGNQGYSSNSLWLLLYWYSWSMHSPATHCGCFWFIGKSAHNTYPVSQHSSQYEITP